MRKILEEKPKNTPGPKAIWVGDLGKKGATCISAPKKILDLIQEKPVKKLLNCMALDKGFKKEILNQVPKGTPHAPKKEEPNE